MAQEDSEVLEKLIEIDKHLNYLDARISTLEEHQGKGTTSVPVSVEENQAPVVDRVPEKTIETPWAIPTATPVQTETATSEAFNVPTANFAPEKNESFEVQLGTKWFSRIGITALVIGIALFLMYSLQYFNALGKIGLGITSAAILMAGGFFIEKKYQRYGQILFGGGVALMYFTTYAAYFFDSSKVMDSQGLDLVLLGVISLLYLTYSLRYKSQTMTGIALSLVYITTNLGSLSQFSLIMLTGVLTIAVSIAAWKQWKFLLFGSLIASYLTFSRWVVLGGSGASLDQGTFVFAVSIITFCYLLYTIGNYLVYRTETDEKNVETVGLVALNTFFYFSQVLSLYMALYDDKKALIWLFFAVFNGLLAVVFRFGAQMRYASRTYLAVSTLALMVFIPTCFTGYGAYLAWLALGLVFILYGIFRGTIRTRAVGLVIMLLAFARLIVLHADVVPVSQDILFFSMYGLATEGLSLALLKHELKREENDDPRNDSTLQGVYAALSVISVGALLAYVVSANYLTLAWGVAGFTIPLVGFAINDKYFRRAGLALLLLTILKLFIVDMSSMETVFKILSFIGLGGVLLLISFGYTKYKDEIGKYL